MAQVSKRDAPIPVLSHHRRSVRVDSTGTLEWVLDPQRHDVTLYWVCKEGRRDPDSRVSKEEGGRIPGSPG